MPSTPAPPAPAIVPEPPPIRVTTGVPVVDDEGRRAIEAAFATRTVVPPLAAPPSATPAPAPAPAPAKPASTPPAEPPRGPDGKFVKTEPPAAAPAAPPAKTPLPDFIPGQTKAADWKALRSRAERAESRIAELESTAPGATNAELTALRRERDDLATRLRLVAIERDPRFESEYNNASKVVLDTARSAVGLVNADAAERILRMLPSEARDAATEKFLESLPGYKQTQFGYALAEMDKLRAMKETKVAESLANWQRLQAEGRASLEAERAGVISKLDDLIARWQSPESPVVVWQKKDGDTEWNNKVDESVALAREILSGDMDEAGMVDAAARAASFHLLAENFAAALAELEAIKAERDQLKGVSPGAAPAGGELTPPAGDDGIVPPGASYGQAIAAHARKLGLR